MISENVYSFSLPKPIGPPGEKSLSLVVTYEGTESRVPFKLVFSEPNEFDFVSLIFPILLAMLLVIIVFLTAKIIDEKRREKSQINEVKNRLENMRMLFLRLNEPNQKKEPTETTPKDGATSEKQAENDKKATEKKGSEIKKDFKIEWGAKKEAPHQKKNSPEHIAKNSQNPPADLSSKKGSAKLKSTD